MTSWARNAFAAVAFATASCNGGGQAQPRVAPATTPLVVGQPVAVTLSPQESRYYHVEVVAGRAYVVAIAGLTAATELAFFGDDATFSYDTCRGAGALGPNECLSVATSARMYFRVKGTGTTDSRGVFLVAEVPLSEPPASEFGVVPAGTFRWGQVATRSSSSYGITGLTPGMNVTVSLLAPTGDADLYLGWGPPSSPDPCAGGNSVAAFPLTCTFIAAADSMVITVQAGPLERDGARYLLLAWMGHGVFRVVETTPGADAEFVELDAPMSFTFSEYVDPATLSLDSVSVTAGGVAVPGAFSVNANVASFVPSSPLVGATRYDVTLSFDVRDSGGAALEPYRFGFTTGASVE